jgi:NAD(P)-dependent dehydrogenase (short-subunit alcohol dehydrogenase family)
MSRLAGKVAIVTGGASRIGRGALEVFLREGARVAAADIQDDRSKRLADELGPSGKPFGRRLWVRTERLRMSPPEVRAMRHDIRGELDLTEPDPQEARLHVQSA